MKTVNLFSVLIIITFLNFFAVCGCKNPDNPTADSQPAELTSDEKEIIKNEISNKIEEVIKGVKNLDVDAAAKPYSNDADFRIVNPDATVTDFQTMKDSQSEVFKTLASMDFKTIKQDFTFLTRDLVICTWTGSNDFVLKSGIKMKIDPYVGTLIFRKKDNEWKIIYAHETTALPVIMETEK
jgi:ketosteroid isomerase-like protein